MENIQKFYHALYAYHEELISNSKSEDLGYKIKPFKEGKEWRNENIYGIGAIGVVFKALNFKDEPVALKVMEIDDETLKEIYIQQKIAKDSFNLLKVNRIFGIKKNKTDKAFSFVVLELPAGLSLNKWLERKNFISFTPNLYKLAYQLFCGLNMVHKSGLLHLDLKQSNIIVLKQDERYNFYIADFGLSHWKSGTVRQRSPIRIGTPGYRSPQQSCLEPFSEKDDIWAMGLILFELLCLRLGTEINFGSTKKSPIPNADDQLEHTLENSIKNITDWYEFEKIKIKKEFETCEDFKKVYKSAAGLKVSHIEKMINAVSNGTRNIKIPKDLRDLALVIANCLNINPDKRPSAEGVLNKLKEWGSCQINNEPRDYVEEIRNIKLTAEEQDFKRVLIETYQKYSSGYSYWKDVARVNIPNILDRERLEQQADYILVVARRILKKENLPLSEKVSNSHNKFIRLLARMLSTSYLWFFKLEEESLKKFFNKLNINLKLDENILKNIASDMLELSEKMTDDDFVFSKKLSNF